MRIAFFTPYGNFSRESGLVYLLANYLSNIYSDLVQIKCNGMISVCGRDVDSNWKRDAHSCFRCMSEQKRLSSWAGTASKELSNFLLPEDIDVTKRWILSVPSGQLIKARFNGVALYDLCRDSFQARFGVADPDLLNKNHEQNLRRFLLSAARVCIAAQRFNKSFRPSMSFVAGSRDLATKSFIHQSREQNASPVVFQLDLSDRAVQITHPVTGEVMLCDLLLEDIYLMRADSSTWPNELITIIEEVLVFLGISDIQLTLPMAQ